MQLNNNKEPICNYPKNNFSEWYKHVVFDLDFLKYYDVSGCYVVMPKTYRIWEKIMEYINARFKEVGVENMYGPLLISEENLSKEKQHLEGFVPEVAWVTQAGESKLEKKLAIRPTSECALYPTFADIVRSHSDLPLKWNQWCSVLRWEFKDPTPFIRSREFLWNEGHCVFADKDSANNNALEMLEIYRQFYEKVLMVPVIAGRKTQGERFPGADETYTVETFIKEAGKSIQCATSHNLGQHFSKIFDIKYQTQTKNTEHAWQTSWGLTTRAIGTTIMIHGDDRGHVFPSSICEYHIVIVPIIKKDTKEKVDLYCKDLVKKYKNDFRIKYDDGDKRPGWKYNYWEQQGIPLRFEVGELDVKSNSFVVYRRDNNTKTKFDKDTTDNNVIQDLLKEYDNNLYGKAFAKLTSSYKYIQSVDELKDFNHNSVYFGSLCDNITCEETIKQIKIKPMCRPLDQSTFVKLSQTDKHDCMVCKNITANDNICLFGRSF